MTDWDDFHRRAHAVTPKNELKPKRCWIGVLSHEKTPTEQLREADFVWMIGHSVSQSNAYHAQALLVQESSLSNEVADTRIENHHTQDLRDLPETFQRGRSTGQTQRYSNRLGRYSEFVPDAE